ncbi:MAG: DUF1559 domain-containing protein [Candidatus Hydrogenedentes bacterium]|nr:DUF1559 domain-containing protein [Candidatus Hydrogenedentota bacterium]
MAEWTSEARDYLEGYLRQVGALARSQGDDDTDIVEGLREHITNEAEAEGGSLITVDLLQRTLATVGTPEQVARAEFTLATNGHREPRETRSAMPPPPPPRPVEPRIVVNQAPQKSRSGCLLALVAVLLLPIVLYVGIAILGIISAITVPAMSRSREAARRAECQNNLKQMGIVYKMRANEHKDLWPTLTNEKGEFFPLKAEIYPEYLTDTHVLVCPSDPTVPDASGSPESLIGDQSYFYLGYAVTNETEARAFLDAYRARIAEGGTFEEDLPAPAGTGTGGGDKILRLTERLMAEAESLPMQAVAQSQIPVMFDREFSNHVPGGINVLYMDGHVEFIKMGGKFPAVTWFLDELAALER